MTKFSPISSDDLYLFNEGSHYRVHQMLGAHALPGKGVHFAVWAPNAQAVSVIGDWNGWNPESSPMQSQGVSGIWSCEVKDASPGACYKYAIRTHSGELLEKADPVAFQSEQRPKTASVVKGAEEYKWQDSKWLTKRNSKSGLDQPMSVYEMHAGSWRRNPEEGNRWLSYRELADELCEYLVDMGFTHVEFMPLTEHPFDGSWGYQTTGYFAPTSRHGDPDDLKYLIDTLHQANIGVILDWVPAHFPSDAHGLAKFDGTHLYEHADPRKGFHPDWNTLIFNFGRNEVKSFLLSSAIYWLEEFHIDALRVDAVASMLYLDYSRKAGEWIPNEQGGRENLEAIEFLKTFNTIVHQEQPGAFTMAEESTAWPQVSRPVYSGGLGFTYKWNMGWMNDTLEYFEHDPVHRSYQQGKLTFSLLYAFNENFVLPLSHDEVVHGKRSLVDKMPGDDWQKFANLRLLYGYMFSHPGKKLLFMGSELGQRKEWNHDSSLDWHLLDQPLHSGLQQWVKDLNALVRDNPALYEVDFEDKGFRWIDASDAKQSVISFRRIAADDKDEVVVVCNLTPIVRESYRIGVPASGRWEEVLNSDGESYGGSGVGNMGGVEAEAIAKHGLEHSVSLSLPPLSVVFMKNKSKK